MRVRLTQRFFKPADALTDTLRAGVVGPIRQPERKVATPEALGDLDGVKHVVRGLFANLSRRIAQGTELVLLILKEIGVDGSGANAEAALECLHFGHIGDAVGQVPEDMERKRRGRAGEAVDFCGVGELLLNGGGGGGLDKLAKARAGVGESPRRDLDLK